LRVLLHRQHNKTEEAEIDEGVRRRCTHGSTTAAGFSIPDPLYFFSIFFRDLREVFLRKLGFHLIFPGFF
jgi:hypothetical protein